MGQKINLLLILNLCLSSLGLALKPSTEQFDEQLTIRTLLDGKVASHFSFTTLLRGATPRDPATLGFSDDCTSRQSIF
jgi:GPI-anchor transamidase subunit T